MSPFVKIENVSKSYGKVEAIKNVSLNLDENKIYGLLGRNGAGKTTLLKIIASHLFVDKGKITCNGFDSVQKPDYITNICCYMPEEHVFPGTLKIKQMLAIGRKSFQNYDVEIERELCAAFNLDTNKKYNSLSRGFQSIFRIVLGLASNAPLTIFDEPVLGLDAGARDLFYQSLVKYYADNPRTFIVSTHLIEESADLYDEAVIIHDGQILKQGTVEDIVSNAFYVAGQAGRVDEFTQRKTVIDSETVNDFKTVVVEGDMNANAETAGLRFSPISFQKLFIHMTNSNAKEN